MGATQQGVTEMSILSFERPAGGFGSRQPFVGMAGRLIDAVRRQQKARRDRRHLMDLPEYLLKDIGLSRMEVDGMAWPDDRPSFGVLPSAGWRHEQ